MPTPGLSLVGFLEQPEAMNLMRSTFVLADASDAALIAGWQTARAKLGPPVPNAGVPDIQPIPSEGKAYLSQLLQQPWVQSALQGGLLGASFQLIELAPLLAFQFNVDMTRSDHHNGGGGDTNPPSTAGLFEMCLPMAPIVENVKTSPQANSVLITSKGLNFQPLAQGVLQVHCGNFVGLQVGISFPLMHVVRHGGRHYLHNGFHRATGLLRRGVTHAPCVIRDVADHASVGIRPNQTFSAEIMESANPPTVGHMADGRAHDVTLKVFTRTLHVSWADHVVTED